MVGTGVASILGMIKLLDLSSRIQNLEDRLTSETFDHESLLSEFHEGAIVYSLKKSKISTKNKSGSKSTKRLKQMRIRKFNREMLSILRSTGHSGQS
mmetsp:Transcript_2528/g.3914  ORF Transcript_2528/g.3914 Transcript_2528/m.3914 type:complete len:97 (+) Transcript_2528:1078-1368(+)